MIQTSRKISRKNILLLSAALLFFTGTVHAQESENNGGTDLKVIHLSPDAGSMDVFIDGEQVGSNLNFGDLVGTELETGVHEVRAESEDIELSQTVDLQEDRTYTLAINNRAIRPDMTLISHDATASENQARLRLAHFSPDLLEVNAELEGEDTAITRNLDYLETGGYTELSPGNYTITVSETRIGGSSFDSSVRLRANTSYTAFITGLKSGSTDQRLRIIPVSERLETQIDEEDDGEDGNGNGNGETDNGEFELGFNLVCRLEENTGN